jgi:hypothetical protein
LKQTACGVTRVLSGAPISAHPMPKCGASPSA